MPIKRLHEKFTENVAKIRRSVIRQIPMTSVEEPDLSNFYTKTEVNDLFTANAHRGVAVYVQSEEPIDQQVNDIWIQI